MIKVDINEVRKLQERRREINKLDIEEISFTKGDQVIELDPDEVERWKFTGLNITDFVEICLKDK